MAWDPAQLLREVWQQNVPLFRERMRLLVAMSTAAADGTLTAEQRDAAEDVAHQMAGSLGMFGFPEGTRLARELEHMLAAKKPGDTPMDVARCGAIVAELQELLNV